MEKAHKQSTVATSTAEAEYIAANKATKEGIYLKSAAESVLEYWMETTQPHCTKIHRPVSKLQKITHAWQNALNISTSSITG
jgi:hypothetical protein